jgi:Dolichyl-phosphate-mannose-protein mannosyltransferase
MVSRGSVFAPRFVRPFAGLLLVALVAQAGIAALRDSVTIDEFVGLPVGLYTLQTAGFRLESVNPPFDWSFAALPLFLMWGAQAPRVPATVEVNEWAMGYRFMADYGGTYHALFVPARCMVILLTTLLGILVLSWATELYGRPAGLVALFLFAFSPTILAHGHLVTLDVAGAVGWTGVAYLTWRVFRSPNASRVVMLGIVLGLAPALKLSGMLVPVLVALLVVVRATTERDVAWYRWLGFLVAVNLLALAVVNGIYRFEGTWTPLGGAAFASTRMRHLCAALPGLRLPLPLPLLKSLDILFVGDQATEPVYFLAGVWSVRGWWYYHFVAFLLKTSLPLVASGLFAVAAWVAGRSAGLRDYCVIVPVLFVFAANSLVNPLDIGVRHVLPVYPLLAIAASPWLAAPLERLAAGFRGPRNLAGAALSVTLLAWFLYGSVAVAPRYLQYFNELAGGPQNGHRWLVDSNVDWGQDLIRLSEYVRSRHLESVHLAYFGRVDPRVYGIQFTPIVEGQSHGTAVVSASFLMGRPYWIWNSPGELAWSHNGAFTWLQRLEPVARVGSMFVFELP